MIDLDLIEIFQSLARKSLWLAIAVYIIGGIGLILLVLAYLRVWPFQS